MKTASRVSRADFSTRLLSRASKLACTLLALLPLWVFGADWRESGSRDSALEVYVNQGARSEDAREINNNKAEEARNHRKNLPNRTGSGVRGVGFKWDVDKESQVPVTYPNNGYSPHSFDGWGLDLEPTPE